MNINHLREQLKSLRLSGASRMLEVRLQEASANVLDHGTFLEILLQDELQSRLDHRLRRAVRDSWLPGAQAAGGLRLAVRTWSGGCSIPLPRGTFSARRRTCSSSPPPRERGNPALRRQSATKSSRPAGASCADPSLTSWRGCRSHAAKGDAAPSSTAA